jgi:hypothetical protein
LARYFDVDYERRGPQQLADFLGLEICEVFPISYDISFVAIGENAVLKGSIPAEPEVKLSKSEIIRLSILKDISGG